MGRAAAARRSIRRPTARPSQRPQAATDPLYLATDTCTRPQARQTRPTSTSRPRIEASAQNEIAFGSGVVARRPPHALHASPKPPTASRLTPAPPTTPLRHLQRPRDGDNAVRPEPDRRSGARGSRPLGRRDYRARAVTGHSSNATGRWRAASGPGGAADVDVGISMNRTRVAAACWWYLHDPRTLVSVRHRYVEVL